MALEASLLGSAPVPNNKGEGTQAFLQKRQRSSRSVNDDSGGNDDERQHLFGMKVVDLASFIAGPSAAVICLTSGADVIKVEPPTGDLCDSCQGAAAARAGNNYLWHLNQSQQARHGGSSEIARRLKILERLVRWPTS